MRSLFRSLLMGTLFLVTDVAGARIWSLEESRAVLDKELLYPQCFNLKMRQDSLPCQNAGGPTKPSDKSPQALDNRFQTAGIFTSYLPQENTTYLRQLLSELKKNSYRGVVNILVRKNDLTAFKGFIEKTPLAIRVHIYDDEFEVGTFKWLQDGLQFAWKDQAPVVVNINSVHEHLRAEALVKSKKLKKAMLQQTLKDLKQRFSSQVAMSCGLEVVADSNDMLSEARDGSSGGNFMPLPGGFWLTSGSVYDYDDEPDLQETLYVSEKTEGFPQRSDFIEPAQLSFMKLVGLDKALDLPSRFIGIGHIDEYLLIVPRPQFSRTQIQSPLSLNSFDSKRCDFDIAIAEPRELWKDLKPSEEAIERLEFLLPEVEKVRSTLEARLNCRTDVVRLPVALSPDLNEYLEFSPATIQQKTQNLVQETKFKTIKSPNQLNALVIQDGSRTLFMTSKHPSLRVQGHFEATMRSYIHERWPQLVPLYLDAGVYNEGRGGVHCATSSIRVCK